MQSVASGAVQLLDLDNLHYKCGFLFLYPFIHFLKLNLCWPILWMGQHCLFRQFI